VPIGRQRHHEPVFRALAAGEVGAVSVGVPRSFLAVAILAVHGADALVVEAAGTHWQRGIRDDLHQAEAGIGVPAADGDQVRMTGDHVELEVGVGSFVVAVVVAADFCEVCAVAAVVDSHNRVETAVDGHDVPSTVLVGGPAVPDVLVGVALARGDGTVIRGLHVCERQPDDGAREGNCVGAIVVRWSRTVAEQQRVLLERVRVQELIRTDGSLDIRSRPGRLLRRQHARTEERRAEHVY